MLGLVTVKRVRSSSERCDVRVIFSCSLSSEHLYGFCILLILLLLFGFWKVSFLRDLYIDYALKDVLKKRVASILYGKASHVSFNMLLACDWEGRTETAPASFQRCPKTTDIGGNEIFLYLVWSRRGRKDCFFHLCK